MKNQSEGDGYCLFDEAISERLASLDKKAMRVITGGGLGTSLTQTSSRKSQIILMRNHHRLSLRQLFNPKTCSVRQAKSTLPDL
jgi:hypothetical protein